MEQINIENVIVKKIRIKKLGNYKYPEGCAAFYQATNYMDEYHKKHKLEMTCTLCGTKTFTTGLKQHQKTKKCLSLRCL
jgi:hypothetical protein